MNVSGAKCFHLFYSKYYVTLKHDLTHLKIILFLLLFLQITFHIFITSIYMLQYCYCSTLTILYSEFSFTALTSSLLKSFNFWSFPTSIIGGIAVKTFNDKVFFLSFEIFHSDVLKK